jgi:hypothetical protein
MVLSSAPVGFSVTVPTGYSATYQTNQEQSALVFGDQQAEGFLLVAYSRGDLAALVQDVLGTFSADAQLTVVGTPQETRDFVRATLQAVNPEDGSSLMLHLGLRQGPAGNVVALIGFALPGQDATLGQTLDSTLASLSFGQPTAINVSLGGLDLSSDGGSSESNSSSDAHLTSIKKENYTFCSDGSYGYSTEDVTMFSSTLPSGDFGDLSSEESDQHQGRWVAGVDMLGQPILFLQASDGRMFMYPYSEMRGVPSINGTSFAVAASVQCQ